MLTSLGNAAYYQVAADVASTYRTREGAEGYLKKVLQGSNEFLSFSGAAPVKVRKADDYEEPTNGPRELQWDRTREGAEGGRNTRHGRDGPVASVGPHP